MPAPNLTPLPGKPVRGENPEDFSAKMNAFLGALGGFEGEMNNVINWLNTINQFVEKALGDHASDPTERNDSSPLQAGDWYFNTTSKDVRIYTGTVWKTAVDTYTVSEVQSLLAGKLGKTETAANTALFDGMASNEYSKFLFKTANTANTANQWSKVARVTLESQYHSHDVIMKTLSVGDANAEVYEEEVTFSVKQQYSFGNNPHVYLKQYRSQNTSFLFGYKIVQNNPNTIVDLYVKNESTNRTCHAFSVAVGSFGNAEYFSDEPLTTAQPSGLVNAARITNWNSDNDGAGSLLDAGLFEGEDSDVFMKKRSLTNDFNTMILPGRYTGGPFTSTNAPIASPHGNLLVWGGGVSGRVTQLFNDDSGYNLFIRFQSWNGAWTSWRRIYHSGNFDIGYHIAGLAAGAIGTPVFASYKVNGTSENQNVSFGANVSGSNLFPAEINSNNDSSNGSVVANRSTSLSGTWKCLGAIINNTSNDDPNSATLFAKIS